MLINYSNLSATYTSFRAAFAGAFEATPPELELLAMKVASTNRTEQYNWLGALPKMKEWLSDAQFEQLSAYKWSIDNKTWQAGVEVLREDFLDDQLGNVMPAIKELGVEAKLHAGRLLADLVNAGDSTACYDGQYFFDTDHSDQGQSNQTNKITGALSQTTFRNLRKAMRDIVDHKGRPMGVRLTHLLVGPALEGTAKDILQAERLASGASNTEYKAAELIVSPYVTSATKFYGFDLSRSIKPLIFQEREAPQLIAQDNFTDEQAFMRRMFRYQVTGRYNAGYGLWQFAAMSTGA